MSNNRSNKKEDSFDKDIKIFSGLKTWFKKNIAASICAALVMVLFIGVGTYIYASDTKGNKANAHPKLFVLVDAGHGGLDPGMVGAENTLEKELNLQIAQKVKRDLEAHGIKVVMTRTDDASLTDKGAENEKKSDMRNRVEMINSAGADCFISIHQNGYGDASIHGAQVFYHESSDIGKEMAGCIQQSLKEKIDPDNTRQAKSSKSYYILNKSECPGVIVECGFLSNEEERQKLISEEYQNKISDAILKGIAEYYKIRL